MRNTARLREKSVPFKGNSTSHNCPHHSRPPFISQFPVSNPSIDCRFASMCRIEWEVHRCGHRTRIGRPRYCSDAKRSYSGNLVVCGKSETSVSNQSDSLCGKYNCELVKKGGVWICCLCRFGYKGSDRNRYSDCEGCGHGVCEDCRAWNPNNVAEMEAEDAANPVSDDTNWSPISDMRGGTEDEEEEGG